MALNCSEINLILDEAQLEGAFIQKAVQSSYTTLILSLYKDRAFNLFFSLEGSDCRLNISARKFNKPEKPLRFMELLRSKIIGLRIDSAKQINANRIVKFILTNIHTGEKMFLYVKLWTGAGNIILTNDQNIIIDAFYRRPAKKEITGEHFPEESPLPEAEINAKLSKFKVREYDSALSFNEVIDKLYAAENPIVTVDSLQQKIKIIYLQKIGVINDTKTKLQKELKSFPDAEILKHKADLLLVNIAQLQRQEPAPSVDVLDYETGEKINIGLNIRKTIQENANDYYSQAKKIISGRATLTESIESLDKQRERLELEYEEVQSETDIKQLQKIIKKLSTATSNTFIKNRNEKKYTGLKFNIDGFLVLVGRSATENDELLRHCVSGSDLWLHVRDYAGGYVFIKAQNKKSIPLNVLVAAGNLAVYYSKAKRAQEACVYYTQAKYLRRAKNAKKGTVLPEHEKILFIKLDKEILEKNELGRIV